MNLNRHQKTAVLVGLINFFIGLSHAYNNHPTTELNWYSPDNNQQDVDAHLPGQSWGVAAKPDHGLNSTPFDITCRNNSIDIAFVQNMHPADLNQLLCQLDNQTLFTNYHLYACKNYLSYAQSRPGYEDFILSLYEKINGDHSFRKSLRYMTGFNGKTGFHDFVGEEAQRIRVERAAREIRAQEEANRIKLAAENADKIKRERENQPRLCITDRVVFDRIQISSIELQNNPDQELSNRYRKREAAAKKTLENGGACFDYSTRVKHPAVTDEYAEVFNNRYGTALDQQLHEELCATRTTMMQLQSNHPDLIQINTISPIVNHFTALAKVQTNPDVAFNLSDFCYHLTNAAQGFGSVAQVVLKGTGKGAVSFVEHNIEFCEALVTHPIDDIAKPLCLAGIALGKAVFYATELAINDPEKFNTKLADAAIGIGQYVRDKPEDAIAVVVELLIPFKAPGLVNLKSAQSVVRAIQEQEQFSRAVQFTSNVVTKITTPIKEVLIDAGAVVSVGLQRGKAAMQNLIKVAEQQPELTSVGDIAALRVPPECFNDLEKLSNEVVTYKEVQEISKKAELLRTGGNGTVVNVKTKLEAEKLLKEAFPDYQKVKGIGFQDATGIRKKTKMDRYKQGGAYHKDYAVDQETGWVRGHENSKHGEYPHINIKKTDGKTIIINIIGE